MAAVGAAHRPSVRHHHAARQPPLESPRRHQYAAGEDNAQRPPSTTHLAVRSSNAHCCRTHHRRAIIAPIQAAHHDGDDEHIPDPSRPQADDHHNGHTRQIFLTSHQQIHLHPAPIVAHFKSEPYHHSIWIFRGHGSRFDPTIGDHKHDAKHFLLSLIQPSFLPKAICHQPRHQQGLDQIQAVHHVNGTKPSLAPVPQHLIVSPHPRRKPLAASTSAVATPSRPLSSHESLPRSSQQGPGSNDPDHTCVSTVACNLMTPLASAGEPLPPQSCCHHKVAARYDARCLARMPPPRSPATNCLPFSTSTMSATAWHIHSEPRRRPIPCALKTSSQLQCPHRLLQCSDVAYKRM
ncbi:hypothetical protein ACLOJK_019017 [Asimina triloba]